MCFIKTIVMCMLYESSLFGYVTFDPCKHVCFTYRFYNSLYYTLFVSIYNSFDFFLYHT
jgi:hypothetical protein